MSLLAAGRCEIEVCPQERSTPARSHDLPVEPPATLAHDPNIAKNPTVANDQPFTNAPLVTSDLSVGKLDPLEMLSLLAAIPSNRS
jgi:hypothetical protein